MKQQPNHRLYIAIFRGMGPERWLKKALELSEFSRALLRRGLEISHPELDAGEINDLYQARIETEKARSRVD